MQSTATMYDFLKEAYERRKKNPRYQARVLENAQAARDQKYLPLESRLSEGAIIHEDGAVTAAGKDAEDAVGHIKGAEEVKDRYQRFRNTHTGRGLDNFLRVEKRLREAKVKSHGYVDLDFGTIAAILTNGKESAFLVGKDYWDQIKGTAMELYVLTHETIHSYGVKTEDGTDRIGKEYWMRKAENAKTEEGREVYSLIAKKFEQREKTGTADWNELTDVSLEYIREELEQEGDADYAEKPSYDATNVVRLSDYKNHKKHVAMKHQMQQRQEMPEEGSIDDIVANDE
jgi:hypothetical protein